MDTFELRQGTTPLLVSMPHDGTAVPLPMAERMTRAARAVPDTDWHVSRLWDFAPTLGAATLRPLYSRYVIDLNRPPDGAPLYPGAPNTGLCPTHTFDGEALYLAAQEPGESEISERRARYWSPYHEALRATLDEIRARHGIALLFDAHSIRGEVPRLFEGRLPDLNLGTNGGASCDPGLQSVLAGVLAGADAYTHVVNGRFTGGYITRHYGDPDAGVHAVQLEQSQRSYMNEAPPFDYREDLAERVRPVLCRLLETMLEWARTRG